MDKTILNSLIEQVMAIMPKDIRLMQDDIQKHFRASLSSLFEKAELVSRQEFDVQSALLTRTRTKLEVLEKKIAELEELLEQDKVKTISKRH